MFAFISRILVLIYAIGFASAHAETIRVGRGALPPTLGVPFTAVGPPSSEVWVALFDALTRIDQRGDVQPALALSWQNTSPTIWRFKLRPGVTFHDGTAFNATAALATFELLRTPAGAKFYVASEVRNIATARKVDDLTIEFVTKAPDAVFPRRLSMIFMVSPSAWATLGEEGFAQKPSGTGPFRMVDWGKTTAITKLAAFKQAWRKPQVDEVLLLNIPEPVRRVQALQAGQIDVAARLGPDEVRQLPTSGFAVITLEKSQVMSFGFHVVGNDKSPVADVRVREALNMAIDREGLAQAVFDGRVRAASQGQAPVTQGFNPALDVIPYDVKRAKQLLAEAGYAKGFKLRMSVFLGQLGSDELVYQNVAQSIRALGVEVELRTITFATWLQNYSSNQWGDTDVFSMVWDSGATYDATRWMEYASCLKDRPFFCDQSVMPLLAAVNAEMDPAKRLVELRALSARMRALYPALWIVTVTDQYAARDNITGVEPWHMGLQYENLARK